MDFPCHPCIETVASMKDHLYLLFYRVKRKVMFQKCLNQNDYKFNYPFVTQDTFGAFLSEPPRISEKFFGTGESWLFSYKVNGALDIHNWRGENNFIMKGNLTSLVIGSGENDNIIVILLHITNHDIVVAGDVCPRKCRFEAQ